MSQLLIVSVTFLLIAIVAYLVISQLSAGKSVVKKRLDDLKSGRIQSEPDLSLDLSSRRKTTIDKTVDIVSGAVPVSVKTQSKFRRMLIHAGYRGNSALPVFLGVKLILAVGFGIGLFIYGMSVRHEARIAAVLGIAGFAIGLIAPNIWLNEKMKRRQLDIFHTLPDVLDLMTVSVEAGLGLDASIIKISEEKLFSKKILAMEFRLVSQEIRAGKSRLDALKDMAARTGVEDVSSLVAMLIQTERLGASLSKSLRVHSDTLRTKRRQRAEEAAAKTTIKLIFPLAFFIFPALLVVLLGPAVIQLFTTLFGKTIG